MRDLLGHSSVHMSLRYAHLVPDQRREAVAKLNEKPIAALTMRFSCKGLDAVCPYLVAIIVGKGGNRTLDPGIMRDMDALYAIYIQSLTMITRLGAGR